MKKIIYQVALIDCKDAEGLPMNVTIAIDANDQETFEQYLETEQDDTFAHAEGGNIEY